MTIHHDKLAYGRLASQSEELSEQAISDMLKLLNEEEDEGRANEQEEDEKDKR